MDTAALLGRLRGSGAAGLAQWGQHVASRSWTAGERLQLFQGSVEMARETVGGEAAAVHIARQMMQNGQEKELVLSIQQYSACAEICIMELGLNLPFSVDSPFLFVICVSAMQSTHATSVLQQLRREGRDDTRAVALNLVHLYQQRVLGQGTALDAYRHCLNWDVSLFLDLLLPCVSMAEQKAQLMIYLMRKWAMQCHSVHQSHVKMVVERLAAHLPPEDKLTAALYQSLVKLLDRGRYCMPHVESTISVPREPTLYTLAYYVRHHDELPTIFVGYDVNFIVEIMVKVIDVVPLHACLPSLVQGVLDAPAELLQQVLEKTAHITLNVWRHLHHVIEKSSVSEQSTLCLLDHVDQECLLFLLQSSERIAWDAMGSTSTSVLCAVACTSPSLVWTYVAQLIQQGCEKEAFECIISFVVSIDAENAMAEKHVLALIYEGIRVSSSMPESNLGTVLRALSGSATSLVHTRFLVHLCFFLLLIPRETPLLCFSRVWPLFDVRLDDPDDLQRGACIQLLRQQQNNKALLRHVNSISNVSHGGIMHVCLTALQEALGISALSCIDSMDQDCNSRIVDEVLQEQSPIALSQLLVSLNENDLDAVFRTVAASFHTTPVQYPLLKALTRLSLRGARNETFMDSMVLWIQSTLSQGDLVQPDTTVCADLVSTIISSSLCPHVIVKQLLGVLVQFATLHPLTEPSITMLRGLLYATEHHLIMLRSFLPLLRSLQSSMLTSQHQSIMDVVCRRLGDDPLGSC